MSELMTYLNRAVTDQASDIFLVARPLRCASNLRLSAPHLFSLPVKLIAFPAL